MRGGALWAALCAVACGGGGDPPRFVDPGPQVAVVGQQSLLNLIASDPEGDAIDYDFSSATLMTLPRDASLRVNPNGQALFTWTPVAADLGEHVIDFVASDGDNDTHLLVPFEVRGAVGEGSAPVFRLPLGEGTVHELGQAPCVTPVEIEVYDPDDAEVVLTQAPPVIDGGELHPAPDGLSGVWEWCPSAEQRAAAGIYDLVLSADDGENPPTLKHYSVWLQRAADDCPSQLPTVDHSPSDLEQLADPRISVMASDDIGLLVEPFLYWSTEVVDPSEMESVSMSLDEGTLQSGRFSATIPNPAVPLGPGGSATVYYRIVVGDEDSCLVSSPAEGLHQMVVTNPGGDGGEACQPCSYDAQCGGASDLCLQLGVGLSACGSDCSVDADCPPGFSCSAQEVTSVQGATGRQCLPDSGQCDAELCEDDDSEPNDTLEQAMAQPPFEEGSLPDRRLCPYDEDWYVVELSQSAMIIAALLGPQSPDLDLLLTNSGGVELEISQGPTSDEQLSSTCLPAGSYALRVFTIFDSPATYQLSYVLSSC